MSREMNGQKVENGIYQSRSTFGPNHFAEARNVYIENGSVQLVADEKHTLFAYDWFFAVNTLGERISDMPEGVSIRSIPIPEPMSAAQLVFNHHQKLNARFNEVTQ
jgi:hypothetical protein